MLKLRFHWAPAGLLEMTFWSLIIIAAVILALLWWVWPTPLALLFQWIERRRAGLRSLRAEHDGIDWHYLEGGHGEPLVLLHGFNANCDHFCRVAVHLREHFRILAPDLPGFGATKMIDNPSFRIEDLAARVLEWLDAVNVHQIYLGGNSMGAYLAAAMARQAPERVRGLWLLAPGGLHTAELSAVLKEVAEDRHNPLVVRHRRDFRRLLDYCFVRPPWIPGPLLRFLGQRAAADAVRAQRIFDAMRYESRPLEELIDGLDVPALIVWGQADQVLHVSGIRIVEQLMPRTLSLVLPNVGHLPMLEAPRLSAEAWISFAESIAREEQLGASGDSDGA